MPDLDKIIQWEKGGMGPVEEGEFFQELIDTGMAWTLQGAYGRRAVELINAGVCHPKQKGGNS